MFTQWNVISSWCTSQKVSPSLSSTRLYFMMFWHLIKIVGQEETASHRARQFLEIEKGWRHAWSILSYAYQPIPAPTISLCDSLTPRQYFPCPKSTWGQVPGTRHTVIAQSCNAIWGRVPSHISTLQIRQDLITCWISWINLYCKKSMDKFPISCIHSLLSTFQSLNTVEVTPDSTRQSNLAIVSWGQIVVFGCLF